MADSRALSAAETRDPHVRANERAFLREALVTEANAVLAFADRVAVAFIGTKNGYMLGFTIIQVD
jgi:hypothetical protein